MKAIQIDQFGTPDVLEYREVSEPQLKAGEVLVRTRAAGVNPIDWKTCSGGGAAPFIGDLPFIPGWELSGVVEACGSDVTGFNSGDKVYGFVRFPEAAGCFAEQVAVPADQISLYPAGCDDIAMGGLGLAGLTAWQALFDKGNLQPKQRVLVLAAAGGVGHLATQLAHWKGAYVIGTASASNHAFLKENGCDEAIDYHTVDVSKTVADVDLIIDGVGGEAGKAALDCLKPTGTLVTLPSVTKDDVIAAGEAVGKKVLPIRVEPTNDQLRQLSELMGEGKLNLKVSETLKLEDAAKAFDLIASGRTQGKVILTL